MGTPQFGPPLSQGPHSGQAQGEADNSGGQVHERKDPNDAGNAQDGKKHTGNCRPNPGAHAGSQIHDGHGGAAGLGGQRRHDGADWDKTGKRRAVGHSRQHHKNVIGAEDVRHIIEPQGRDSATAGAGEGDGATPSDLVAHPAPEEIGNHVGGEHDAENLEPLLQRESDYVDEENGQKDQKAKLRGCSDGCDDSAQSDFRVFPYDRYAGKEKRQVMIAIG